ncbi:hypothetical protein ACJX0J_029020 [Zea mays]
MYDITSILAQIGLSKIELDEFSVGIFGYWKTCCFELCFYFYIFLLIEPLIVMENILFSKYTSLHGYMLYYLVYHVGNLLKKVTLCMTCMYANMICMYANINQINFFSMYDCNLVFGKENRKSNVFIKRNLHWSNQIKICCIYAKE